MNILSHAAFSGEREKNVTRTKLLSRRRMLSSCTIHDYSRESEARTCGSWKGWEFFTFSFLFFYGIAKRHETASHPCQPAKQTNTGYSCRLSVSLVLAATISGESCNITRSNRNDYWLYIYMKTLPKLTGTTKFQFHGRFYIKMYSFNDFNENLVRWMFVFCESDMEVPIFESHVFPTILLG